MSTADQRQTMGRRICVVGSAGKTSLARSISRKTGLPWIELDALHWLPGWKESSPRQIQEKVAKAIEDAPNGWICDGNYISKIGGLAIGQADTVLWVNMPWPVVIWRIFLRSVQRAIDKKPICGNNYESWRNLISPDSLILWHLRNPRRSRLMRKKISAFAHPDALVIEIGSPRELNRFYEDQELVRET